MKEKRILQVNNQPLSSTDFFCLRESDVITRKVSDHHPIIHDGVLFGNVMMQCNTRGNGINFNNGFGLIESDEEYIKRLILIAQVIAEAVYRFPSIEAICLCEGPIKSKNIAILFYALMQHPFMGRFMMKDMFHKPTAFGQNWGLLMLADTRNIVTKVPCDSFEDYPTLANRFQLWKLEQNGKKKYIALAHFPFAGDEHKTEKKTLSSAGHEYCNIINMLIETYSDDNLIFCADFNFNPYLISQWQDRTLDKISHNNSILLTTEGSSHRQVKTVTVDGILLSRNEKKKYYSAHPEPGLFEKLKAEYRFFRSHVKDVLLDLAQNEHDKQFGLVPYHSS